MVTKMKKLMLVLSIAILALTSGVLLNACGKKGGGGEDTSKNVLNADNVKGDWYVQGTSQKLSFAVVSNDANGISGTISGVATGTWAITSAQGTTAFVVTVMTSGYTGALSDSGKKMTLTPVAGGETVVLSRTATTGGNGGQGGQGGNGGTLLTGLAADLCSSDYGDYCWWNHGEYNDPDYISISFWADGTFILYSTELNGYGNYTISGTTVTLVLDCNCGDCNDQCEGYCDCVDTIVFNITMAGNKLSFTTEKEGQQITFTKQ